MLSKVFILKDISLYSVSGTYMTLGIVLLGVLVVMLLVKMPEGKDDGCEQVGSGALSATVKRLWANKRYRRGVVAQFFYVGAQLGVWSFTIRIVMQELGIAEADAANVYLVAIVGFCVSRFLYTWLMRFFAPAKLLVFGSVMSVVCALVVVFSAGTGWLLVTFLVLISVFMSLMFPTIYGLALENVERPEYGGCTGDAKIGASGLIMAILGGAILTPLQGVLSDTFSVYTSFAVPVLCFLMVLLYAVYSVRKEKR